MPFAADELGTHDLATIARNLPRAAYDGLGTSDEATRAVEAVGAAGAGAAAAVVTGGGAALVETVESAHPHDVFEQPVTPLEAIPIGLTLTVVLLVLLGRRNRHRGSDSG